MTDQPRIAVVIPCFNDGATVREAIRSAQAQEPCEIVVVDDGSSDPATQRLFPRLRSEGITVINQANAGPGAARNAGLHSTAAQYVFPLDADDYLIPGRLSVLADYLDAHPNVGVTWGRFRYVGERTHEKHVSSELDPWAITFLNDLPVSALFRRVVLLGVGGWQHSDFHEDWYLWMTLAESGTKGHGLDLTVFCHRMHGSRRRRTAIPRHEELREALRRGHPTLFEQRNENRRRSPAPWAVKSFIPLTESVRLGSRYRRAWLAAVIWHVGHGRLGYHRPIKRLIERLVQREAQPGRDLLDEPLEGSA